MKNNLVIIMADQLRADVLSPELTPNLDALRKESMEFTRAYCACPLCVPARGAFFTGRFPNSNGSLINPWLRSDEEYGSVRSGIDNIYTLMEKDWCSIHSGKQHLFTQGCKLQERADSSTVWAATEKTYKEYLAENGIRTPGGPDFKTYVPEMHTGSITRAAKYSNANTGCYGEDEHWYFDRYFADRAVDAVRKRDRTRPLMLNMMFLAPHPPLEIPEPWYSRVSDDDFTLPDNVGRFYPYQSPLQLYNLTGAIGTKYTREQWKESWRVYLGLVAMLDDCVGQVINALKEEGVYDDSFIVFTSDHGEMLGSHALFQKMCMYQESAHVPLYIKLPDKSFHGGTQSEHVVSHIDVFPTIMEYFGIEHGGCDGRSLLPLLMDNRTSEWDDAAYIQFDGNGARSNFQRCIIHGEYKLIADYFKDEIFFELYNTEEDPEEKENLLFRDSDHDAIASEMAEQLSRHMLYTGDMIPVPLFDAERFRSLYKDTPAK